MAGNKHQDNSSSVEDDDRKDDIKEAEIKEKSLLGKITPKRIRKPKFSSLLKKENKYKDKAQEVVDSISQLLLPFQDILIKTLPFTKRFVLFISKLFYYLGRFTILVATLAPFLVTLIKARFIKIVLLIILLLFITGNIISRVINNANYIANLELSLQNITGFEAIINGKIRFSLLPSPSISINGLTLFNENIIQSSQIKEFTASTTTVKISLLYMLIGQLRVSEIILLDLIASIMSTAQQDEMDKYQDLIKYVEHTIQTQIISSALDNQAPKEIPNNMEDSSSIVEEAPKEIQQELPQSIFQDKVFSSNNTNTTQPTTGNLFNTVLNNLKLELKSLKKLTITRGKIRFLNADQNLLLLLDNVSTNLLPSGDAVSGNLIFRLFDKNFDTQITLLDNNHNIDFKLNLSFIDDITATAIIEGQVNPILKEINGRLSSNKIHSHIIQSLFIPKKSHDQSRLSADFTLNNYSLNIKNMQLIEDNNVISGNMEWPFQNQASVEINLDMQSLDVNDSINKLFNYDQGHTYQARSSLLSTIAWLDDWKNMSLDNLKARYIRLKITSQSAYLNDHLLEKFQLSVLLSRTNNLYIDELHLRENDNILDITGKIDIDSRNAVLKLNLSGDISESANLINLPPNSSKFILLIGDQDPNYNLSSRLVIDNNRYVFNNLSGNLGAQEIHNTYAVFIERLANPELIINTQIDNLNAKELQKIYFEQLNNNTYVSSDDFNIFGLKNNLNVNINLKSNNFNYKELAFPEADFDIQLTKNSLEITKAQLKSSNRGEINASFKLDDNLSPKIAGFITFSNFYLKGAQLKQLAFDNYDIVGNILLNGRVKFISNDYFNPLSNINGEITVVKAERVQLNRYIDLEGLSLTLTESQANNKVRIDINDIYGKITIKDNVIDVNHIITGYFYNNQEYRGTFAATYYFNNNQIMIENGRMQNVENIRRIMNFSITDNLVTPVINRSFITTKEALDAKELTPTQDLVTQPNEAFRELNEFNNPSSEDHFDQQYNLNTEENAGEKTLTEQLYEDSLQ